jgi:hypothetical protein
VALGGFSDQLSDISLDFWEWSASELKSPTCLTLSPDRLSLVGPHDVPRQTIQLMCTCTVSPQLHIGFGTNPLVGPSDNAPRALVIGAGITGLSTAWTLLDSGYRVKVIADQFPGRTGDKHRLTSQIAGALYVYTFLLIDTG